MSLLGVHRTHLEQQRHAMNLVGPGDLQEHYDDCERALHWLEPDGSWADLGSGAGFPGVVLAAMFPHLQIDLVESRLKRVVFLEQVVLAAGASQVRVRHERVEALEAHRYHGVVARAFAPVPKVLDHAARLLLPRGTVVLFLQDAPSFEAPDGFEMFHVERYRLGPKARMSVGLTYVGT